MVEGIRWFYWQGDALAGSGLYVLSIFDTGCLLITVKLSRMSESVVSMLARHQVQSVGWKTPAMREYLYWLGSFVPQALLTREAQSTQTWHYHCDPNGAPFRLTSPEGDIVWSGQDGVWGERNSQPQRHKIDNPLRFQGQYYDAETGLHYNRHRYYDPHIAAYISQDPIGLAGGINPYQYAPNPLMWVDPLGLQPKHRGRIQAQGSRLEDSFSWAQDKPISANDALRGLNELESRLGKKDRELRKNEFSKARKFIENAEKNGGVDAQVSKTFLVKGTAHERVDIEVSSGKAFVADSDLKTSCRK